MTSKVLVLLRLWVLWERNVRFMTWTLLAFVIIQIAVLIQTVRLIVRLYRELSSCSVVSFAK